MLPQQFSVRWYSNSWQLLPLHEKRHHSSRKQLRGGHLQSSNPQTIFSQTSVQISCTKAVLHSDAFEPSIAFGYMSKEKSDKLCNASASFITQLAKHCNGKSILQLRARKNVSIHCCVKSGRMPQQGERRLLCSNIKIGKKIEGHRKAKHYLCCFLQTSSADSLLFSGENFCSYSSLFLFHSPKHQVQMRTLMHMNYCRPPPFATVRDTHELPRERFCESFGFVFLCLKCRECSKFHYLHDSAC